MSYRYGIDGERIEIDDEGLLYAHPTGCDEGWITVDGLLTIVRPCPRCRPQAAERLTHRPPHPGGPTDATNP